MIPQEILSKYNMLPLNEYKVFKGDTLDTERMFYQTFLIQTDHIPAKIFEDFIDAMVDDNVNMGGMKKFFKEIKTEHADVLAARKTARAEINRIEAELAAGA